MLRDLFGFHDLQFARVSELVLYLGVWESTNNAENMRREGAQLNNAKIIYSIEKFHHDRKAV